MAKLKIGDRVRILNSNFSALKKDTVHVITEEYGWTERGYCVLGIDGWLFPTNMLEKLTDGGQLNGNKG